MLHVVPRTRAFMGKNVITQWNSNLWDDSDRGSGGWNKLRQAKF